jgi:hypothetical protein
MDRLLCCADFYRGCDVYCQSTREPQGQSFEYLSQPFFYGEVSDPWMYDYREIVSPKGITTAKCPRRMNTMTELPWAYLI